MMNMYFSLFYTPFQSDFEPRITARDQDILGCSWVSEQTPCISTSNLSILTQSQQEKCQFVLLLLSGWLPLFVRSGGKVRGGGGDKRQSDSFTDAVSLLSGTTRAWNIQHWSPLPWKPMLLLFRVLHAHQRKRDQCRFCADFILWAYIL